MRTGKLKKITVETPSGSVRIGSRFRKQKGTYSLSLYGPEVALKFIMPSRGFGDSVDKVTTELTHPSQPIRLLADLRHFRDEVTSQIEDRALGFDQGSDSVTTLKELSEKYLENATHLAEKTWKENRYRINVWMGIIGENVKLADINSQTIRLARDKLLSTPAASGGGTGKPRTRTKTNVNNCLGTLMTVLNWGHDEGYMMNRDYRRVKKYIVADKEVDWWQEDSVRRVMAAASEDSVDAHIFVALGIYLGLRRAEIDMVMWGNFDRSEDQWVLTSLGKGQKMRHIPVCSELQAILEKNRGKDGDFAIRPSRKEKGRSKYRFDATKTFSRVIRKAQVPRITIHAMRHTFASICLKKRISLYKVSKWLGHSSIRITEQVYAHATARDEEINMLSFEKPT